MRSPLGATRRPPAQPIISEKEATRLEEWIDEAVSGGAEVLCGGKRDGSFFCDRRVVALAGLIGEQGLRR